MFSWLSPSKEAGAADSSRAAGGGDADTAAVSPTPTPTLPPGVILHANVWCDGCGSKPGEKSTFSGLIGKRFKCLVCPNVDLCQDCFVGSVFPAEHSDKHEVLVYPTPASEVLQTHNFAGLKCSYCARESFFGSAYTCAACPPPASGSTTSVWCESCEW